ncbi:MAG: WD40 repeat domain-containing protein [Nitrospira sp.]|nr:WD40 repeat domain-containing protein [Nitrospira sp.]
MMMDGWTGQKIRNVAWATVLFLLVLSPKNAPGAVSRASAAFSDDGRLLVVQMEELAVWNLETKTLLAKIPDLPCLQIVLMKQDGWVLCVGHSVTLYDWKNRTAVATIPSESREPYQLLAYSSETDQLILRHGNEAVSVWQLGKKLIPLKHIALDQKKDLSSVAASPDARQLAIAQGHSIHLYDLSGTTIRDVTVDGIVRELLFAPNSATLAVNMSRAVFFIETNGATVSARATLPSAEGTGAQVTLRLFSRDSQRLVAENGESSYALVDVSTGKLVALTEFLYEDHERGVRMSSHLHTVDISADGEYLVGQSDHLSTLQIWDLSTGTMLPDLCGHDCRHMGTRAALLKWSPTGAKVIVVLQGGLNPDVDGKVSVWDVSSHSPELVLDSGQPQAKVLAKRTASQDPVAPPTLIAAPAFVHGMAVRAVATSPHANLLVTTSDDGLLKIWDPGQGMLLRQLKLPVPASALAFSADGAILVVGSAQGEIRLWETHSWREFPSYASGQGQIKALQFLPGNRVLVIAGEQPHVSVVDLVTRTVVKELVHSSRSPACVGKACAKKRAVQGEIVEGLSFLDGTAWLMTISRAGRVVWDSETWREVEKPAGIPEVWSSLGWNQPLIWTTTQTRDPKSMMLAIWDPKRNVVWAGLDIFTKRDVEVDHGPPVALGTSVALDPQQRWAATRVGEHISVWDLSAQAKRTTFHVMMPSHLHWTSDGKHLIVSTLTRKILVWSLETMRPSHYLRDPTVTR